jgi:hypothetical protein
MFQDCSNINASGSHLSNIGRDQYIHQTVVNVHVPATASSDKLHGQQELAELRLHDTVRHHRFSRAAYLTFLCRLPTKPKRKQIGE